MIHVHWWLVALAFVVGLVLTFVLIVRPLKRRAAAPVTQTEPESTDATATEEFFTTATAEGRSRPAEPEFATTVSPVGKESATTETSAPAEMPADVGFSAAPLPVEPESAPTGRAGAEQPSPAELTSEIGPPPAAIPAEGEHPTANREEESTTSVEVQAPPAEIPARGELSTPPGARDVFPTTPADDAPTVTFEPPTTVIPVGHEPPRGVAATTEVATTSAEDDAPTTAIPAATEPPTTKTSLFARLLRKGVTAPKTRRPATVPKCTRRTLTHRRGRFPPRRRSRAGKPCPAGVHPCRRSRRGGAPP